MERALVSLATRKGFALRMACLCLFVPAGAIAQDSDRPPPDAYPFPIVHPDRGLSLHDEMFVLPFTYAEAYSGRESEIIFQLSAKHRLFGTRFYFAYTQLSFWQAFDIDNSAPFRETNYNPEFFYRSREWRWARGHVGTDAGFEHESNGQPLRRSRSWNQLYVAPWYRASDWLIRVRLRWRIPEEDKTSPDQATGDDNPDITDYLGYSDVRFQVRFASDQFLHLHVRGWIGTGKGNVSLGWSPPLPGAEDAYFFVRVFHGYGESLIEYDRERTRVGVGILFNR